MTDIHLVFDVESAGIQGEGFAVGWVVLDRRREKPEIESGRIWTRPENARGTAEGHAWVEANVRITGLRTQPTHPTLHELRTHFWERVWAPWKLKGASLWADVAWPVEARFLAACVDDALKEREWRGPYPLLDVSTLYEGRGIARRERDQGEGESPEHDPLADARYSGHLLLEALEAPWCQRTHERTGS